MALSVKFYGTRGLIMSVSRDRYIYGGHTPCIAVLSDDDLLILDSGFGIANLSAELMQKQDISQGNHHYHLLLSHFHWDHIQGLQYFSPIYFKGNKIHIYSPFDEGEVREVLNLLLDDSYSPFSGLDSLPCDWHFEKLEKTARIGPFSVSHHPTVHIGECFAYRITTDEGRIVYSADHDAAPSSVNESFVEWSQGCDLLIHEAMYTPGEYQQSSKLGHSSFVSAMQNAQRIEAPLTLLTHHQPLRSDSEFSEHERYLERLYNTKDRKLAFAREGVVYKAK